MAAGDEIRGTSILHTPQGADGSALGEYLLVFCVPGDGGKPMLGSIPVRVRGTPENGRTSWEYDIHGDTIHVTPSLKMSQRRPHPENKDAWVDTEIFHNGADWRVKFERTTPEQPSGYELFCLRNGRDFV